MEVFMQALERVRVSDDSVEMSASPGGKAPPNKPADQKTQRLGRSAISSSFSSSTSSLLSTGSQDRVVGWGERRQELRKEVVAEAEKQTRKLTDPQIEEEIGKKIDRARWVTRRRRF